MVDGISGAGAGRIEAARVATVQRLSAVQKPVAAKTEATAGAAARAAASEPPVDAEKVARIRTAIAEGRYPVDPQAIAGKMIELDLGDRA